jgi:transglutaminase-like putative cysteine protease
VTDQPHLGTSTVGCRLSLEITTPASIALQVAAAYRTDIMISDRLSVAHDGVPVATQEIIGPDRARQHLVRIDPGTLTVAYDGTVTHLRVPPPAPVTDADRITFLRPSRYCPSDRMAGFAQSHFGELPTAMDRVQAICAYVWRHIGYEASISGPTSDAVETLLAGRGVCRDFAHLVVVLCRAVEVPARVAAVYAPGLSPMDFHAVAETAIDGAWWSWDATRLAPRHTLVRIGTGRDAADIAFATVLSGRVELSTVEIWAIAGTDLPLDDHIGLVALG